WWRRRTGTGRTGAERIVALRCTGSGYRDSLAVAAGASPAGGHACRSGGGAVGHGRLNAATFPAGPISRTIPRTVITRGHARLRLQVPAPGRDLRLSRRPRCFRPVARRAAPTPGSAA